MLNNLKTALVHEWLTVLGGSERVVKSFTKILPQAPIYTSVYNPKTLGEYFSSQVIKTSYLQKLPFATKIYPKLLPLMPGAFEKFNLMDRDIVLSSSSSCAKGVITGAHTMHVSYIHSPMRYAWDLYFDYLQDSGPVTRFFMKKLMPRIRQWDSLNTQRVDYLIANSSTVAQRIEKYYRRKAVVINPPVDTSWFNLAPSPSRDYYFTLSRLIPYKRIDLAVEAFNRLGKKLLIAGAGPELGRLKKMAKPNVEFLGRVSEEESRRLYQNAKAFLFPGFEDFGITPVEAMASGTPVIAYGKGGVRDSVVENITGVFFPHQSVESLIEGVEDFENRNWDPKICRKRADVFSVDLFEGKIQAFLEEKWQEFSKRSYELR